MKKSLAIIALFFLVSLSAEAQRIATWKGGQTGRPRDWNCPTNWKEGRVPNEFSNVFIPDVSTSTFCYPLIDKGIVEVASLEYAPNARVDVRGNARFIVLDALTKTPTQKNECLAQSRLRHDSLTTNRN